MNNVTKSYRSGGVLNGTRNTVLRDFSLSIREGERVGLHGPSGCGKSTVARLAAGLTSPDNGEIRVFGRNPSSQLSWVRNHQKSDLQILFQDPTIMLNPMHTLAQNLSETQSIHNSTVARESLIRQLRISHLLNRTPVAFSGGEWRRAALARVLLANPKILIADEPTTGLDIDVKKDILDLLLDCTTGARALLLISHDVMTLNYVTDRRVALQACS